MIRDEWTLGSIGNVERWRNELKQDYQLIKNKKKMFVVHSISTASEGWMQ
jgi:hypothetical protein